MNKDLPKHRLQYVDFCKPYIAVWSPKLKLSANDSEQHKESNERDYDEDQDQLEEEKQEEQSGETTVNQVFFDDCCYYANDNSCFLHRVCIYIQCCQSQPTK